MEEPHRASCFGGAVLEEALLLDGIVAEGVAACCSFACNLAVENAHSHQRSKTPLR